MSPLFACSILAALSAAPAKPGPAAEPVIRVGLQIDAGAATVSSDGQVRIWRAGSGLAGSAFGPGCAFRLVPAVPPPHDPSESHPGLTLIASSGDTLGTFEEELLFEPLTPHAPLEVEARPYRGELAVHATREGGVTIVNAVRIDDYLRGVLPLEMGAGDATPASALEAQAIAARSYSLFYLGRRAEQRCDLLASTEDQVYGGMAVETPAGTRAVLTTRGIVATHRGRPIRANYCSTCGGMTEASDQAWRGERFPYLRRVKDRDASGGALCSRSRLYRWKVRWARPQLEGIVLAHLPEEVPEARRVTLGRLRDLRIVERTSSGRVRTLEVRTEGGTFRVDGDRVRRVVRTPEDGLLYSTLWGKFRRTADDGGSIELEGGGYGHGVGMCQFGALELARRGASAEGILRHYYRGVVLARWW